MTKSLAGESKNIKILQTPLRCLIYLRANFTMDPQAWQRQLSHPLLLVEYLAQDVVRDWMSRLFTGPDAQLPNYDDAPEYYVMENGFSVHMSDLPSGRATPSWFRRRRPRRHQRRRTHLARVPARPLLEPPFARALDVSEYESRYQEEIEYLRRSQERSLSQGDLLIFKKNLPRCAKEDLRQGHFFIF